MKNALSLLFLMVLFNCLSAQGPYSRRWDESEKDWYRRMINFDYSVPDYDVSRPDSTIVGWRMAKILLLLEKNYEQDSYNRLLAKIRNEQLGEIKQSFLPIDKLKVTGIQKKDSIITITIHTLSKTEKRKKVEFDLILTFVNCVSADEMTNRLFCELGRYVKREEE